MSGQSIFITGGDGFVGRSVCDALARRDYRIISASRTAATRAQSDAYRRIALDLTGHGDLSPMLEGVNCVVHLAARTHVMRDTAADPLREYRRINTEGTARLATAAARAGVRRFVFLSSIKVNGENTTAAPFTEGDEPHPEDAYGLTKWEAERALRVVEARTGMEVVIVRPPLVYGAGVTANFLRLMQLIARGVPLPLSGIDNRRSMIFVRNLADAVRACIESPHAAGNTYLASDGVDLSTPELIRRLAHALAVRPRLFAMPQSWLTAAAAVLGQRAQLSRLTQSLQVDSTRLREHLQWTPPYSIEAGFAETTAWFRGLRASTTNPVGSP
jgi:nucleoside-diphosphate-sugar epimerase